MRLRSPSSTVLTVFSTKWSMWRPSSAGGACRRSIRLLRADTEAIARGACRRSIRLLRRRRGRQIVRWRRRGRPRPRGRLYTGVARVDGTEDAEAVSTDLLEKAAAALTTAVDDGSFLTKLRTNAAERSPEAAAAFNAITVDETATRAHIGRASRVFVVTTPEPTAAPTPRPLSPPTPKPTPAPTPRPSLTMSPVPLVSGGSGSGSGAAGPDAAAMGGGVAAGALVLLLTAGAFVFYRRTVARDAKANAGPGVVDEAGGLEAPLKPPSSPPRSTSRRRRPRRGCLPGPESPRERRCRGRAAARAGGRAHHYRSRQEEARTG